MSGSVIAGGYRTTGVGDHAWRVSSIITDGYHVIGGLD
jgi:hypothetical protein